jgi:hypothetical protein
MFVITNGREELSDRGVIEERSKDRDIDLYGQELGIRKQV